ncbi:hypothetical protein [Pollutibacter soli]|uniref:amidohydrolase family protein n=1 Tax=Pollutibacter soli TaxID=3034157 RepID=UPI003013C816
MRKAYSIFILLLISAISVHSQNTIIKAGHLFDARTGKMLDNQFILVQNGKIKEAGANIKHGKNDSVIDLSDSWVLPGLMDCHVHITSNNTYRNLVVNETYTNESNAFRALRGAMVAKQLLENGFTTIKEIGTMPNMLLLM